VLTRYSWLTNHLFTVALLVFELREEEERRRRRRRKRTVNVLLVVKIFNASDNGIHHLDLFLHCIEVSRPKTLGQSLWAMLKCLQSDFKASRKPRRSKMRTIRKESWSIP